MSADRLVFLDESGAATNLTRLRGRCARGDRLVCKVPGGHWKIATIIGAVRIGGPVKEATAVIDGPLDAQIFSIYVREVLAPTLRVGDVVVMDNLSSHKGSAIRQAIEAVGARLEYLPQYSPDFNPIENCWSKVKQRLRTVAARTFDTLTDAVADAISRVTADDCHGFFANTGYAQAKMNPL